MISARQLLASADDRTGSLEVGGIVGTPTEPVPVGPNADHERCCVVDTASRHLTPEAAFEKVLNVHQRTADYRCHKMDAGLRGNWPHEIHALVELGYRVAVVPSFPDAGRQCRNGVVYIQGVPVLESPFGSDPLTAPCSSRPLEVLEEAGCIFDEVVVWDADNNAELNRATYRSLEEDRVLVGPAGALGSYAAHVLGEPQRATIPIAKPVLILCGSLNATSRQQLEQLTCTQLEFGEPIGSLEEVSVLATPMPSGSIDDAMAVAMAKKVADLVHAQPLNAGTLIVIGGDTVAAIVGDETLHAIGTVDSGIPVSRYRGSVLITKGGGIGVLDSLVNLVNRAI